MKQISLLFIVPLFLLISLRGYSQCTGTVTDTDGNVYNTVLIGNQCWMQQNLKTAHYRDGSAITEVEDSATWANILNTSDSMPAWCYNGEDTANNAIYGKLYNWFVVADPRQLCPTGWHVPDITEWAQLTNYLGGDSASGGHLRSTSSLWMTPNINADNSSGFTALPGGSRNFQADFNETPGYDANFWSSVGTTFDGAWYRALYYSYSHCDQNNGNREDAFSVRCIGNATTGIINTANQADEVLRMYPNPANDILNIYTSNIAESRISLFDITGRIIFNIPGNGTNIQTFNIGNLPSGIYIATYTTINETITRKIIKQ